MIYQLQTSGRRLRLPVRYQLEIRNELEEIYYFKYQSSGESQLFLQQIIEGFDYGPGKFGIIDVMGQ